MMAFDGLAPVLGVGFGAFVYKLRWKSWVQKWWFLMVRDRFWERVLEQLYIRTSPNPPAHSAGGQTGFCTPFFFLQKSKKLVKTQKNSNQKKSQKLQKSSKKSQKVPKSTKKYKKVIRTHKKSQKLQKVAKSRKKSQKVPKTHKSRKKSQKVLFLSFDEFLWVFSSFCYFFFGVFDSFDDFLWLFETFCEFWWLFLFFREHTFFSARTFLQKSEKVLKTLKKYKKVLKKSKKVQKSPKNSCGKVMKSRGAWVFKTFLRKTFLDFFGVFSTFSYFLWLTFEFFGLFWTFCDFFSCSVIIYSSNIPGDFLF